jgi:predicted acyl esterase
MRKIFFFLLMTVFVNASAQNPDSIRIVNNYIKKEVYIPMRDGVKLFTAVYIPKDTTETHPFLMTRTPYSCQP